MFPLPSTTISFQPKLEIPLRSACRTIDPSGSLRSSSLPVTSRRPSGNQSMDQPRPAGPWPVTRAVAVQIDRDDLARSPVGEPQPALMPARRFHIGESVQQDFGFRHGRCVFFRIFIAVLKGRLAFLSFHALSVSRERSRACSWPGIIPRQPRPSLFFLWPTNVSLSEESAACVGCAV